MIEDVLMLGSPHVAASMKPRGAFTAVRSGEVALLRPVFDRDSATRALVLAGPPGIGKSTTLDALLGHAGDARVHRVAVDEMSRSRPFGLIADLVGIETSYPPRADTAAQVLEAVESLCADRPLVLAADDVHHADPDSLAALAELAAATADLDLVLLLTRRLSPPRSRLTALTLRPQVLEVEVTGLDTAGLAAMVEARFAAPPGPRLVELLAMTQGSPFHAGVLLDDLARHGGLRAESGVAEFVEGPAAVPARSVEAAARAHLALVDEVSRALLQILAVWGRPATVDELARVADTSPVTLVEAVEVAVGSGVAHWLAGEHGHDRLYFVHDVYRDIVIADLAPPLRAVLHAACAQVLRSDGAARTDVLAHHHGSRTDSPRRTLHVATSELQHAPGQAADLLADAAHRTDDRTDAATADHIALARVYALTAAGQLREARQVARDALTRTNDPEVRVPLVRAMLHSMVTAADTEDAIETIERLRELPLRSDQQHALAQQRHMLTVLGDRDTIAPRTTDRAGPEESPAAVALELFLRGRCRDALTALEVGDEPVPAVPHGVPEAWADLRSAPTWPALITIFTDGPAQARQRSLADRRHAQQQGRSWLTPGMLFISAGIDYIAGRWDDALATAETGLEAATASGLGWTSRPVAQNIQLRIRRGELDRAASDLARWRVQGLPEHLGLPLIGLAEALLHEAHGRLDDALEVAGRTWSVAMDSGRLIWAPMGAPDVARIAARAEDAALLARIATDTASVVGEQTPVLCPAADLARAVADQDPERAGAAATAFAHRGHVLGELAAREEAAVAAAARGEHEHARAAAAGCIRLAATLGAVSTHRRLAARLRGHDVRLAAPARRPRPDTGWGSLTPTELRVAELVGEGLTSPQIAARLYLSPRTIQTHISHSLRKLQLRSRSQLAATVARHHR